MNDWSVFIESVPWFVNSESKILVGEQRKCIDLGTDFQNKFPLLSKLLIRADKTSVTIDDSQYELFAWDDIENYRIGWVCPIPPKERINEIYEDHNLLFTGFGGIIEQFNEPENTWLLNMNDSLTLRESIHDGSFIEDYRWSFDDAGVEIPIVLNDYYLIAREANGNATLCHRKSGNIVFWAPDHSFDHISVFKNCPEYTLYSINGVTQFSEWVENIARQWLNSIA